MNEQMPEEGGTANTPPFPRRPGSGGHSPEDLGYSDPPEGEESLDRPSLSTDHSGASQEADEIPVATDPQAHSSPLYRRASAAREEVRRRAERTVNRGFERFADRLDDAADRLDRLAQDHGPRSGAGRAATGAARSTAGWMENAADYFRTSDLEGVQADLERHVREKPLQTLLLAVAVGWLAGRIMR